jgi:NAD-dependent SIR2 family protein deacetylase
MDRARSYLGYPRVQRAKPNMTHYALAKLSLNGVVKHHITQNVHFADMAQKD